LIIIIFFSPFLSQHYKVIEAVNAAKERMEEQEVLLQRITDDFRALQTVLTRIRTVEVDLSEEVERCSKEVRESEKQALHWAHLLEQLRLGFEFFVIVCRL
jgi:DNA repair exonuclease SbcCD ATPase subunit